MYLYNLVVPRRVLALEVLVLKKGDKSLSHHFAKFLCHLKPVLERITCLLEQAFFFTRDGCIASVRRHGHTNGYETSNDCKPSLLSRTACRGSVDGVVVDYVSADLFRR